MDIPLNIVIIIGGTLINIGINYGILRASIKAQDKEIAQHWAEILALRKSLHDTRDVIGGIPLRTLELLKLIKGDEV